MVVAVLTMFVGNVAAIAQTSVKRMLAYSSIAHIGFALLGLVAANELGYMSVVLYMVVYLLMNFGAFGGLIMLRRGQISGEKLDDFSGLAAERPGVGLMLLILFFSLAGVPPTVGFIGKLYPILAVVQAGHIYVAVLAVLASVIGAFFYLRVVWYIYFNKPEVKFENVNLSPGEATLPGRVKLAPRTAHIPVTKADRPFALPLSGPVLAILRELQAQAQRGAEWVFPGEAQEGHLTSIDRQWRRVRKLAGVPELTIHDLRATCASWRSEAGDHDRLINAMLNQVAPQNVVSRYVDDTPGRVREAFEAHGRDVLSAAGVAAALELVWPSEGLGQVIELPGASHGR